MNALTAANALIAAQQQGPGLSPPAEARSALIDTQLREYFAGEMAESYAWAGLGVVGLAVSIPLFVSKDSVGQPLAVPIFVLSLVQLALGIGLWVRTRGQVSRLSAQLDGDPFAFAQAERARMRGVNTGFKIYRIVEFGLLFAGAGAVAGTGWINKDDAWLGAGLGLALECVVFLVLDFFADARGAKYEAALLGFGS